MVIEILKRVEQDDEFSVLTVIVRVVEIVRCKKAFEIGLELIELIRYRRVTLVKHVQMSAQALEKVS